MSSNNILVKNGRLLDPANNLDTSEDLYISDGQISGIGKMPQGFTPDQTIDASGLCVCPGLVDLSARLREPGAEHKATIFSETLAAAKAGITTVCLPPDTDPVIDDPSVVELIQKRALQNPAAHIVTLGALTVGLAGKQLTEMAALKKAGCVGVSNALRPTHSSKVLRQAMEYAATHDLTLHVVPLVHSLAHGGMAHEGKIATLLGLQPIPTSAETVAIAQHLSLIEEVGIKTHFGRLSSARAVEMIDDAKQRGLPVTADVAIHQLYLTEENIAGFNSQAHVIPPLRTSQDRDALLKGIKSGVIDAICSDHQPHEADAKLNPFPATEPGISGIDTLLGLSLNLVETISVSEILILGKITQAPANILNQKTGALTIGNIADICLYNPDQSWIVSDETLNSTGKNTPFSGHELRGRAVVSIVGGNCFSP